MNLMQKLFVVLVTLASLNYASAQEVSTLGIDYTIIGGGRVSGLYYPAAGAVCELFNRQSSTARCYVESNPDSFANLQALRNGSIDFAIVQSDWVRQAAIGNGPFKNDGADGGYEPAEASSCRDYDDPGAWRPKPGGVRVEGRSGAGVLPWTAHAGQRAPDYVHRRPLSHVQ